MNQKTHSLIADPKIQTKAAFGVVGLSRHYPFSSVAEIPDQWQSFALRLPGLKNFNTAVTFGVIYNGTNSSFDYLAGVECPPGKNKPANMVQLDIAEQRYAVFQHTGHVATVRATCDAIWSHWLPESGFSAVEAPWFERYPEHFDPPSGDGGLEIWIPITT